MREFFVVKIPIDKVNAQLCVRSSTYVYEKNVYVAHTTMTKEYYETFSSLAFLVCSFSSHRESLNIKMKLRRKVFVHHNNFILPVKMKERDYGDEEETKL